MKKPTFFIFAIVSLYLTGTAQTNISSFKDLRDNQVYKTVKIGNQIWMAQNLNYKTEKSRCYNDSISNCKKYGRLYDWETANLVCPKGWHLPNELEWEQLEGNVDSKNDPEIQIWAGTGFRGFDAGKNLKSTSFKKLGSSSNSDYTGTDLFGFNSLPSGAFKPDEGFLLLGYLTGYWTSTSQFDDSALGHYLQFDDNGISCSPNKRDYGFSVRCVKD